MADWYVSSVAYAALPAWQATHAYSVGNIIKPVSPTTGQEYAFRCTTAGTSGGSEPSWNTAKANNGTRTDSGATWTNVSGQSTYNWSAPAGTLWCITNASFADRTAVGDRVFLSSDHAESGIGNQYAFNSGTTAWGVIEIISVSRAGSVPPVAADVTSGASITGSTGAPTFEANCNLYWNGVSLINSAGTNFYFNTNATKSHYLKNCALYLNSPGSSTLRYTSPNGTKLILDNTTLQFSDAGQTISGATRGLEIIWLNTPSALAGATFPTSLFGTTSTSNYTCITCRGVDLSAVTGTLVDTASTPSAKVLLDSCKISSGVTRYATPGTSTFPYEEIELVNCYDGTTEGLNERYQAAGSLTTERTIVLTNGAADDVGGYSLKMVSSSRSDFQCMPLESFWFDVENTSTGSSKTATVEIVSSASLNNVDIISRLEYYGTSSSTVTSFADSLATPLTASAAVTTSTATWTSSPSTPVYQKLQITFTPHTAGRVRAQVRLGKASTTVYVNPQVTIT
jgi:hypothetical protein